MLRAVAVDRWCRDADPRVAAGVLLPAVADETTGSGRSISAEAQAMQTWCAMLFVGVVAMGAETTPESFVNALGMRLIQVRPDQYLTGTMLDVANWQWYEGNERPRWVTLAEPFALAAHEVTNAQYRAFVAETGHAAPRGLLLRGRELVWDFEPWQDAAFNADSQPVVCLTLADAEAFCAWLSAKDGRSYSLPSADEWEFACRAGTGTDYNWGSAEISPERANYDPFLVEYAFAGEPPGLPLQQALSWRGGSVGFSAAGRQASGEVAGHVFAVTAGSQTASVDGQPVPLGTVPEVLAGGDLRVPVSFLANDLDLAFRGRPLAVGSFAPNRWGFYDMHGNVNEITSTGGDWREVRGGGWNDSARRCRSASRRDRWRCTVGMAGIGFRVRCAWPAESKVVVEAGERVVIEKGAGDLVWKACYLLARRDGTLVIHDRRSQDGGRTWEPCPVLPGQPVLELSDGRVLSIPSPRIVRDRGKGWGSAEGLCSRDGWRTTEPFGVSMEVPDAVGGFTDTGEYHDTLGVCDHGALQLPNGDLLLTMYGFFASARVLSDYQRYPAETQQWKYVSWLVTSEDQGATWRYLSTVIYHPELTRGGGCELDLVRLADGRLLSAARTGEHGYPNERMLFTWSDDEGRTWGRPRQLAVDGKPIIGIWPKFVRLDNGILALLWGRTGYGNACLAFSVDGRGEEWTGMTPLPFDGSGMCSMAQTGPGMLLVTGTKAAGDQVELCALPVRVALRAPQAP
jgi:formylglycine-generating enzyme required for sulfatase activity